VTAFAIRGFFRGSVAQVFGVAGIVAGLVAGGWVLRWVGHAWLGARPAVFFWLLRSVIALLAGFSVAVCFRWIGERLREGLKGGPVGVLDRLLGVPVGFGVGVVAVTAALMMALLVPYPDAVPRTAARAEVARPLMAGGVKTCSLGRDVVPGSRWLGRCFEAAAKRTRAGARPASASRSS
jgi:colicin V production protein